MTTVCVVGSANLDLVAATERLPGPGETVLGTSFAEHPGGKGLNQAVAAARVGATTSFIGAVGADAAGARLLEVLRIEHVDHRSVRRVDGTPTGRALITVDAAAENAIVVVPGANLDVRLPEPLPAADVVLAQLEIPIEVVLEAFRRARAAGARTILNPAPAAALPAELLEVTDVVIPNEHELDRAGGVERLLAAGVGAVVITRGAAGLDVHTPHSTDHVPPFAVTPVDTTGAGDACCGTIAARLAAGEDVLAAARWGAAAGALATTMPGAVPGLPHRDAVERLVSHP